MSTPYDIRFREDVEYKELCMEELENDDLEELREAILDDYYFQARGVWRCGVANDVRASASAHTRARARTHVHGYTQVHTHTHVLHAYVYMHGYVRV